MLCFENSVSAKGEAVWMSMVLKKAASNNTEVRQSTRAEHVHESRGPFVTSTEGTKKKKTAADENIPTTWPSGNLSRNRDDIYSMHHISQALLFSSDSTEN